MGSESEMGVRNEADRVIKAWVVKGHGCHRIDDVFHPEGKNMPPTNFKEEYYMKAYKVLGRFF